MSCDFGAHRAKYAWEAMTGRTQRRRAKAWVVAIVALLAMNAPVLNAQAVRAWRGTITIPTYKFGPPDPDPSFQLNNSKNIYPYTMLDDLTDKRVPEVFQAIYLENQYLRITMLPQLGGHVYSVYDKVDHREVLYRNHVIKYGLIGPRGAWISGGMEFNFPYAHTMDTVSPVESLLRHNPDGSATAIVGAVDWISNMHWEIALTLRPRTARVQQAVTLFNCTQREHLYLFWTNAAVKATDDLQYIYPMRETISHGDVPIVQSWPVWKGVDRSWYKNIAPRMAIFGRDVHRNFFGVYYHQSDYGVVHVANFRQDPGKKIWSWGTAPNGTIWDKILTDNDGPYNEIQSGRFYTQNYREFMEPGKVERWTEYWYPVRGLKSGFVEATSAMAANVLYPDGSVARGKAVVEISPVEDIPDANLTVKDGEKVLAQWQRIHFVPLQTSSYPLILPSADLAGKNLNIEVRRANGDTLLHWSAAAPLDGNPDFVSRAGTRLDKEVTDSPETPTQALFLKAEFLQKTGDIHAAINIYDELLQRDPDFTPALQKEAWYNYAAANLQEALRQTEDALNRDEEDPSLEYAAGVIDRAAGRLGPAKDAFWAAVHYGGWPAPSFVELGEIAIQQRDYKGSATLLKHALEYNPEDALALADLAVAERLGGNSQDAARDSGRAARIMPLLPYALAEEAQDQKTPPSVDALSEVSWVRIVNSDPQNYLAIAAWYHSLGAWQASDAVLKVALTNLSATQQSPMIDLYLASNAWHEGDAIRAEEYATAAAESTATDSYPNQLTDVSVLRDVLDHDPKNLQADYALGNFFFAHSRYEEAASLWRQAASDGFRNSVILRNLGLYEWQIRHDLAAATRYYSDAINLSPDQYRLYPDLDKILEQEGDTASRDVLFRKAPSAVLNHDTVRARHAILLVEHGSDDEALSLLAGHIFTPWEDGPPVRDIFVSANIEKGKQALREHQLKQAAEAFRIAMQYPDSLGTGEPSDPDLAEQYYWLGVALQAQHMGKEAESSWKRATAEPGDCPVYAALAYKKLGEAQRSTDLLQQCEKAAGHPGSSAAELLRAGIAKQLTGSPDLARSDFQQAIAVNPLFWKARVALASLNRTIQSSETETQDFEHLHGNESQPVKVTSQ
jgi:tetratricopeptide (TPR) repeat protein